MAITKVTPNPPPSTGVPSPASSVPPTAITSRRLTVGSGNSGSRSLRPACSSASVPFLRLQGRLLGRAGLRDRRECTRVGNTGALSAGVNRE